MRPVKVTHIGKDLGIVLPDDVMERLRVGHEDELCLIETPDGYELTRRDSEYAHQMAEAQEVMEKDREALRKLAE
jgi:putative addiction module antidote